MIDMSLLVTPRMRVDALSRSELRAQIEKEIAHLGPDTYRSHRENKEAINWLNHEVGTNPQMSYLYRGEGTVGVRYQRRKYLVNLIYGEAKFFERLLSGDSRMERTSECLRANFADQGYKPNNWGYFEGSTSLAKALKPQMTRPRTQNLGLIDQTHIRLRFFVPDLEGIHKSLAEGSISPEKMGNIFAIFYLTAHVEVLSAFHSLIPRNRPIRQARTIIYEHLTHGHGDYDSACPIIEEDLYSIGQTINR